MFESEKISSFYNLREPTRYVSMPLLVAEDVLNYSNIQQEIRTESFIKSLDVLKNKRNKLTIDVRFACLQNWFARSAWFNKLHFIINLLEQSNGLSLLQLLLKNITTAFTKDAVLVVSQQSGGSAYDRVPLDDNRDLDLYTLSYVRTLDQLWFISLDEVDQLSILEGLLHVGGGALTYRVYSEALNLLSKREQMNLFIKNIESVASIEISEDKAAQVQKDLVEEDGAKKESQKKKKKEKGKKEKKKEDMENNQALILASSSERNFFEDGEEYIMTYEEINLEVELKAEKQIWKAQVDALRKSVANRGLSQEKGKKRKPEKGKKGNIKDKKTGMNINKEAESLEMVQMLPLSVNRAIAKLLDKETADKAKKVDSYWAVMIDDARRETDMREKLRKNIEILDSASVGARRSTNDFAPASPLQSFPSNPSLGGHSTTQNLSSEAILQLFRAAQLRSSDKLKDVFLHKHYIFTIISDFMHTRVMKCEKRGRLMAVTVPKFSVVFYSLLTAARVGPCLEGHSSTITCMNFHSDGSHIFTGSSDKTIRFWDIWSCRTIKIYEGHHESVNAISASKDYVASGGQDKQLRVFHVWSGQCVAAMLEDHPVTTVKLQAATNSVYSGCHCGEIRIYDFKTQILRMQISAHKRKITALHLSPPLLLSSSVDGFIKVWKSSELGPNCLLSLDNGCPVRAISLCLKQVLSGCQNGHLRIWDLTTGSLVRRIQVTQCGRPIFHLHCTEEMDFIKVTVSGDTGLKIYEFHPPRPIGKTIQQTSVTSRADYACVEDLIPHTVTRNLHPGLQRATICNGVLNMDRVTQKMQRMNALAIRGAADSSLRCPITAPTIPRCVITDIIDDDGNKLFNPETGTLGVFPRLAVTNNTYGIPVTVLHTATLPESKLSQNVRKRCSQIHVSTKIKKPKKPNHKTSLKLYNVGAVSL